jgi:hypothetical protein
MDSQAFVVFVAWLAVCVLVIHLMPWVGAQLSATMVALGVRPVTEYKGNCPKCGVELTITNLEGSEDAK